MDIIILLIVGGLMAWLCSTMAEKRNRSAVGWAIGGFMFGLLAVILLALLGEIKKTPTAAEVAALEAQLNKEKV